MSDLMIKLERALNALDAADARAEAAARERDQLRRELETVERDRQDLSDHIADLHTGRTTETNFWRWRLDRDKRRGNPGGEVLAAACGDLTICAANQPAPTFPLYHMVFDVESIGLHGEGFAVGYVVIDEDGFEVEAGLRSVEADCARGNGFDRRWVHNNIPPLHDDFAGDLVALRRWFWGAWRKWATKACLWVDCGWPVEAHFLAQCVEDQLDERGSTGPYPLHEIATAAALAGCDPLATQDRLTDELPAHNPLNDARQSARLLAGYLRRFNSRKGEELNNAAIQP